MAANVFRRVVHDDAMNPRRLQEIEDAWVSGLTWGEAAFRVGLSSAT